MDLSIPRAICPVIHSDLSTLLAIAETYSDIRLQDLEGISYLLDAISASPSSAPNTTKKAPAKRKAARNDGRRKAVRMRREIEEEEDSLPVDIIPGSQPLLSTTPSTSILLPLTPATDTHLLGEGDGLDGGRAGTQVSYNGRWEITENPREAPKPVRQLIVSLSVLRNEDTKHRLASLEKILLSTQTPDAVETPNLLDLANKCLTAEGHIAEHSYLYMHALLQFVICVDYYCDCEKLSRRAIGRRFGISAEIMGRLYPAGARLAYVALCGSPYLLVLLALKRLRYNVCHVLTPDQMSTFGLHLRELPDNAEGVLLRGRVLPIIQNMMQNCRGSLFTLVLPTGNPVNFWDTHRCDEIFEKSDFKLFRPPNRSPLWHLSSPALIDPVMGYLPPSTIRVTLPIIVAGQKCPFEKGDEVSWTKSERLVAEKAVKITSVDELIAKLTTMEHQKIHEYIYLDTDILQNKCLHLRDKQDQVAGVLFTHMPTTIPQFWDDLPVLMSSLYGPEFFKDNSRRDGYDFKAYHYHMYNRYSQAGTDAPENVHPDHIRTADASRTNFSQRVPRPSTDIQKDSEEYSCLSAIIEELMKLIRVNMKKQLPEEYKNIEIYCKSLSFGDLPASYPFAGVVINFCVSCNGHRDWIDKLLCVVIPFGKWEGGELCLYELGLVIKLKPGDILIFPSCNITHFNLHFSGLRGSIVLHSDIQGDKWVTNLNGWSKHIITQKL